MNYINDCIYQQLAINPETENFRQNYRIFFEKLSIVKLPEVYIFFINKLSD